MTDVPPPPPSDPPERVGEPTEPAEPTVTTGSDEQPPALVESVIARSVYLYAILLGSVIGMVAGGIIVTSSLVHVIEPDTGHRDALDRVAVGLAEVGREGVDIAREYMLADTPTLQEFCPADMPQDCVDFYDEQYGSDLDVADSVDRVITSFKDETQRQIRTTSIGWLIVGLVLSLISLATFRAHSRKAALYRT